MSFPVDLTQYELIREIGCTNFSTTYAARCVRNDKVISIKKIDLDNHPLSMNFLKGEMGFWSEMSFPNMMKYYGSIIDKNILYIFTEYANHGPLLDIINFQYPNGIKDELLISSILREILIFLTSFHQSFHIHRSLETRNIFVGNNGNIQVGGFWRARSLIQDGKLQKSRNSKIESSCYTAPELVVDDKSYHQSVDVWSLGIIAYELAIGKTPYSDYDRLYQIKSLIDNPPPSLPIQKVSSAPVSSLNKKSPKLSIDSASTDSFSSTFRNFIFLCLQKDPKKRPTAFELLNHKFIIQAKGTDYIYSNMVIQLPQLSHRFSLSNKSSKNPKESDVIETKEKINFNFCGMDKEDPSEESSDIKLNNVNNYQIRDLQRKPSFDSLDLQTFGLPNSKLVKSRSQSIIALSDSNSQNGNNQIQVIKKGRFTISVPISRKVNSP